MSGKKTRRRKSSRALAVRGELADGRVQGFLAGMGVTALFWMWIERLRKANV